MANIKLYYVEGITREDTLYFSSIAQQVKFFEGRVSSHVVDESFYPPYYQNKIKFDSDDIDFNSVYNYLSIEYLDKIYYYFINRIEYLNERTIMLHITMDTIQTFMFDIRVDSALVERQFIDRFTSNHRINRSYIRENFSKEDFILKERHINDFDYTNNYCCGFFVIKATSKLGSDYDESGLLHGGRASHFRNTSTGDDFHDNLVNYFLPVTKQQLGVTTSYHYTYASSEPGVDYDNVDTEMNVPDMLTALSEKESSIISIIYVPFNSLSGYFSSAGPSTVVVDNAIFDICLYDIELVGGFRQFPMFFLKNYHIATLVPDTFTKTFDFSENTSIAKPYSSKYLPVMFDENYIQVKYGTLSKMSGLSLFNLNDYKSVDFNVIANPLNGKLFTYVEMSNTSYYNFTTEYNNLTYYGKIVSSNSYSYGGNVITYPLVISAWTEYVTYNKFSLLGALASDAISVASYTYSANIAKEGINSMREAFTDAYGEGEIGETTWANFYNAQSQANNPMLTAAKSPKPSSTIGELTKRANAAAAPNSLKSDGDFNDSFICPAFNFHVEIHQCSDYERVSYYYHMYGYHVAIPYIGTDTNLFEEVKNRYYFNYIKCSYIDLHINALQSHEVTDDIISRYKDGLRLWNLDAERVSKIGEGYKYDNLEIKYLS